MKPEVPDFPGRSYSVTIDAGDRESDFLEKSDVGRNVVHEKLGVDQDLARFSLQKRLAVHVDAALERVFLGEMKKLMDHPEPLVAGDESCLPRGVRERYRDLTGVVGLVKVSGQPDFGIPEECVPLVEDGEHVAGGSCPDSEIQGTLPDERAAALAVPNELYDVDSGLVYRGKIEYSRLALEIWIVKLEEALLVGDQSIEIERGGYLFAPLLEEVDGVDAVELDDEGGDVFHAEFQRDRFPALENRLVCRPELQCDALFEGVHLFGGKHRVPLPEVPFSALDPGFREYPPQIVGIDIGKELIEPLLFSEQVFEIIADEGFIVPDAGKRAGFSEIRGEVRHEIPVLGALDEIPVDVGGFPGEGQILDEEVPWIFTHAPAQEKLVVEHIRLEGIMRGGKGPDELPQAVDV